MDILNPVIVVFVALVGFPAFLTSALNIGKMFNMIPNDSAPKFVFWANLIALIGVGVAVGTGNLPVVEQIDSQLGVISKILVAFGTFATEVGLTRLFYKGLRGLPIVGYSHSLAKS